MGLEPRKLNFEVSIDFRLIRDHFLIRAEKLAWMSEWKRKNYKPEFYCMKVLRTFYESCGKKWSTQPLRNHMLRFLVGRSSQFLRFFSKIKGNMHKIPLTKIISTKFDYVTIIRDCTEIHESKHSVDKHTFFSIFTRLRSRSVVLCSVMVYIRSLVQPRVSNIFWSNLKYKKKKVTKRFWAILQGLSE